VCGGRFVGAHLVQNDGNSALRDLPGGFGAGQAAADNMNVVCVVAHRPL
jgi:hypothetical protein